MAVSSGGSGSWMSADLVVVSDLLEVVDIFLGAFLKCVSFK